MCLSQTRVKVDPRIQAQKFDFSSFLVKVKFTQAISHKVNEPAVHEPDHNLSTTNPSSDEDKKLPKDDTVIATTSFPTHTKEELSYMQKADPTIKEFLKFWEKGMKLTLGERKKLSHQCASLLRQWD